MADERYGQTRVSKIRAAYNDLRSAIYAGDMDAALEAFRRYESWSDYIMGKDARRPVLAAEARGLERAAQAADDWFYDPEEDVVTDRRLGSAIRALITPEMRAALEQEQGK